jgi:hypothetical protein
MAARCHHPSVGDGHDDATGGGLAGLVRALADGRLVLPPAFDGQDDRAGSHGGRPPLIAVGWGTVDLERATAALTNLDLRPAPPDLSLGARARLGYPGPIGLVVLEPLTEGRLAAFLARHGEGLAVLYEEQGPADRSWPEAAGTPLGRPGRLAPGGSRWGPFVIRVRRLTSAPGAPGPQATAGRLRVAAGPGRRTGRGSRSSR